MLIIRALDLFSCAFFFLSSVLLLLRARMCGNVFDCGFWLCECEWMYAGCLWYISLDLSLFLSLRFYTKNTHLMLSEYVAFSSVNVPLTQPTYELQAIESLPSFNLSETLHSIECLWPILIQHSTVPWINNYHLISSSLLEWLTIEFFPLSLSFSLRCCMFILKDYL